MFQGANATAAGPVTVPKLDIVVVAWNSEPLLSDCIGSIPDALSGDFLLSRVVVVDNGSTYGSAGALDIPGIPISVVRNRSNLGFAAACNQGAEGSSASYLLFLNPDTRLLPGSLALPISLLESEEGASIGICGIESVAADGTPHPSVARFPTFLSLVGGMTGLSKLLPSVFPTHFLAIGKGLSSGEVDQVMGAFLLIRRDLFERLGGFDERLFLYFEDVDMSHRAARAGWGSYHLAEARYVHVGRASSLQAPEEALYWFLKSRTIYLFKHFDRATALALTAFGLVVEPVVRVASRAWSKDGFCLSTVLKVYSRLWSELLDHPIRRGPAV